MKKNERGNAACAGYDLGAFEAHIDEAIDALAEAGFSARLWEHDPTLWKEGEADGKLIKNSLGWLTLDSTMSAHVNELVGFAAEVRESGFTRVALLGMGGSSLAPLVLATTFGDAQGFPEPVVLDSTDPGAVKHLEESGDLSSTLFIVSSKSGSTIEPMSLFKYFHVKLHALKGDSAGANFVAITDAGSSLETLSREFGFRRVFLNPADVGGRFSALSYFGLVPAVLSGIDVSRLLTSAGRISQMIRPNVEARENPALRLGAALAVLAESGRDKVTFLLSNKIETFGLWIEQLLAESTGKEGNGLVPITGEPALDPAHYGPDRVFVSIEVGPTDASLTERLAALVEAGHPVISFHIDDTYDLGGEFFRWEAATAVAGRLLGINPFDQPDVESAKVLARARIEEMGKGGTSTPPGEKVVEEDGLSVWFGPSALERLKSSGAEAGVAGFLSLVGERDYLGILAYYDPSDNSVAREFASLRAELGVVTNAATQFGFGPRYLHSTGQLHKGGPGSGLFLIFTHAPGSDIDIPGKEGQGISFSALEISQAYGDMEALDSNGRPVALFVLKDPTVETLKSALRLFKAE